MEPKMIALVGVGGAIGAVLRYMIGEWLPDGFPWGTLTVNLLGSFLLGVIIGMSISPEMGLLLGTGIMGAFTTMSAYSIDLVELFESSEYGTAASYLLITLLGCPLLAYGGMKLIQTGNNNGE